MRKHPSTGRPVPARHGFALLLVTACILLVSVALVGVSRRSLLLALESTDTVDRLQERWGRFSLQHAAVQTAVDLYGAEPPVLGPQVHQSSSDDQFPAWEDLPGWAPVYRWQVLLRNRRYTVVMADESAKANLNTVLQLKSPAAAQKLAVVLGGRTMSHVVFPQLDPGRPSTEQSVAIRSWGDVLPIGTVEHGELSFSQLVETTDQLTLWSDGRVDLLRASDDVLFGLSRLILSDAKSRNWVREFRASFPAKTPEMVLRELGFADKDRVALLNLFRLQSTTVSVWVFDDGGTNDCSLCLAHATGSGVWETRTLRYTP